MQSNIVVREVSKKSLQLVIEKFDSDGYQLVSMAPSQYDVLKLTRESLDHYVEVKTYLLTFKKVK
ncbi:MAG: hypothetical protein MJ245_02745 [Clostridia bacterium]|nr:hypothetical protein [Clostridia bacterium]